jgi:hypothetical protein
MAGMRLSFLERTYIHVLTLTSLVNLGLFEADPRNYTNKDFLYADFDVNNTGMPQEYIIPTKPALVPSVSGGILWEDTVEKVEANLKAMRLQRTLTYPIDDIPLRW